ncbi:hypothetical protein ACJRO7_031670 [Eucalyptus globulus]|uniref:Uncharacterized protein n=1 Tax=Eucalyptus globulus TaxID=34317 RepID=A0ABD3JR67_EUCGL
MLASREVTGTNKDSEDSSTSGNQAARVVQRSVLIQRAMVKTRGLHVGIERSLRMGRGAARLPRSSRGRCCVWRTTTAAKLTPEDLQELD